MALITPAALTALNTDLSLAFQGGYDRARVFYQDVATVVPSGTTSNTYGWMQQIDALRQWVGPRVVRDLAASSYSLTNLPFELTLAVDRFDFEDQTTGVYQPRAAMMGMAAAKWPDQQVAPLIANGGAGLCFDGLSFFNANHPLDPAGVQGNTNTLALTPANYATARAAMMAFTGEDGQPLGIVPDTLIVVPQLEQQGKWIVAADLIADPVVATAGVTNVNKGTAKLLVVPELAALSATAWYLADCSKPIRPFIWQLRKAPEFAQLTDPNSERVMFDREFVWGVEARGAAGYGPWWLCYRGNV
jgi:phage major head subunit gpT-like protein